MIRSVKGCLILIAYHLTEIFDRENFGFLVKDIDTFRWTWKLRQVKVK
jgi:hypothetical protein